MKLRYLPMVPLLVLAACAAPGAPASATPSADPTPTARSTPEPTPSIGLASVQPTRDAGPGVGEITITGHLGFDDIEGGCAYLQAADGTRYQVLWPDGWMLDGGGSLIGPSGEAVAGAGEEVTIHGAVADDMASICQIGPIFRASEVVGD